MHVSCTSASITERATSLCLAIHGERLEFLRDWAIPQNHQALGVPKLLI